MRAYIATCMIGVFATDENGNILTYKLFPKEPEMVAKALASEKITQEEKMVIGDLATSGYKEVTCDKKIEFSGVVVAFEKENSASKFLKQSMRKLANDLGFVESQQQLNEFLSRVNVAITKSKMQKPKKDKILMSVIGVIDELDKTANTFVERLREWYSLHSPEVVRQIPSNEKFAEIIAKYGHRNQVKDEKIKALSGASGMDFEEADVEAVKTIAKSIESMYDSRKRLEKYLESIARETVPNMSVVAGPLLASRFLQLAGGLDKLARMPSSTVQLLGAEKALFRHLKQGGKPPKFGVLFAHPYIQNARQDIRGKVARLIAAKITFAARIDAYSERDDSERLKGELEEEVKKATGSNEKS